MKRRKHTLLDNVVSAAIGIACAVAMIPNIIEAHASVEPIIMDQSRYQVIDVSKDIDDDRIVIAPLIIEPLDINNVPNIITIIEETTEETTLEEELKEIAEPYFPYTQEDIYLVGNTTFHEAGVLFKYCSKENATMAAKRTASCVVNRARMNYMGFGNSIERQIFANQQYACASKVNNQKQKGVPEIFYEIAETILRDGPVDSVRLVYQSEFKQGKEYLNDIYNQKFGLISEAEYAYYMQRSKFN